MIAFALTIAVLAPSPQSPQSAPRALETYPLRGIVGHVLQPLPPPMQSFLHFRSFAELSDVRTGVDNDVVLMMLRDIYRTDVDNGRLELDVRDEMLIAKGDPGTVADVGRKLDQLTAVVARGIAIEAALYELTDGGAQPGPIAGPEAVAAQNMGVPIWSASVTTRSGARVALGTEQATQYVYDFDVEVAEKAVIWDPKVEAFFEGVRLLIEPHALAGTEDLALFCWFAFGGRRAAMETHATVPKQASVDVPRLNFNTGRMSGRIADQGALVVTVDGAPGSGSRLVLVVGARHAAPPVKAPEPVHLIPTSALSSPAFRKEPAMPRDYPGLGHDWQNSGFGGDGREVQPFYGPADPEELRDMVAAAVEGLMEREHLETIRQVGPFLYGRGPADAFARVEQVVQRLQDRWLRNTEVRVRTRLVQATDGPAPFGRPGAGAPQDGSDLHSIVLPALLDRQHVVSRGTETTVIRDYDVEIAGKASAANPIVAGLFTGVSASVRPFAATSGIGADLLVDLTTDSPPRYRPAENAQMGDLYLSRTGRARFRQQAGWRPGAWLTLGIGPLVEIDGRKWRTRQDVSITLGK